MEVQHFLLTVLLFSGFHSFAATYQCTYDEFDQKFGVPNVQFQALTAVELDNLCRQFVPELDGIVEYLRECRNSEMGKSLRLYEVTKEILDDLCNTDSPLRKKYLDNIKCLMVDNQLGKDCSEVIQPLNYNEANPCSTGFMLNGCMYKDALDKCGTDGLYVMKTLGRAPQQMIERSCCENREVGAQSHFEGAPQSQ